jgi:hypothetical protein
MDDNFAECIVGNLARAYLVALEGGQISRDSVALLRSLWCSALGAGKAVNEVGDELVGVLNDVLDQRRERFLSRVPFRLLRTSVSKFICGPFVITIDDVLHTLHDLEPPRSVRVQFPPEDLVPEFVKSMLSFDPRLDVGDCVQLLLPMGPGTAKRARFQAVALANRWWRPPAASADTDQAKHESPTKRRSIKRSTLEMIARGWSHLRNPDTRTALQEDGYKHSKIVWDLYGAVLAARIVPFLIRLLSFYRMFRVVVKTVGRPLHAWIWSLLELVIMYFAVGYLYEYGKLMQLRVPIVTVKLHRAHVEAGYLRDGDYEHYSIEHWKSDNQPNRTSTCRLSDVEETLRRGLRKTR